MIDLELKKDLHNGSHGQPVKLIQEWLCLHGINVVIDGEFGSATESAVILFQEKNSLPKNGIVTKPVFEKLIKPMTNALLSIDPGNKNLGQIVVAYAKQHLKEHPREIGGQNKGPWVRLYMSGHQGVRCKWCAGFACFIVKEASKSLKMSPPIKTYYSCDLLAKDAKEKGIFLSEADAKDRSLIKPGSLFLNRRTSTDWTHTGIVIKTEKDIFHTIEGNTNDDGTNEGYEVCQRIRNYKAKDFILI